MALTGARFVPNPMGIEAIGKSNEVIDDLQEAAEAIVAAAQSLAPVDSGDYRDGLSVQEDGPEVAAVGEDWKSGFVEFGTANNPAYAPLRRGAEQAGYKVEGS